MRTARPCLLRVRHESMSEADRKKLSKRPRETLKHYRRHHHTGAWQLVRGVPGKYAKSREFGRPSRGVSRPEVGRYLAVTFEYKACRCSLYFSALNVGQKISPLSV